LGGVCVRGGIIFEWKCLLFKADYNLGQW
jgi:hypothetical protein